jgi:hypothetical protein
MKDRMNLDRLRHMNGHIGDNSIAVNITPGMDEHGRAHTYGSEAAANARNDISAQEFYNGDAKA